MKKSILNLKVIVGLSLYLVLILCSNIYAQTLTIDIKDAKNKTINIAYFYGAKQYILGNDGINYSLKLDEQGKGELKIEQKAAGTYIVLFPPKNNYFEFIYEGKDLNIVANMDGLIEDEQNSISNNILAQLNGFNKQGVAVNNSQLTDAEKKTKLEKIENEYEDFVKLINDENPEALIVKMINANKSINIPDGLNDGDKYAYYQKHFFDHIDFEEEWLLYTVYFGNKINTYLDKVINQDADAMITAVDDLIKRAENNEDLKKYLIIESLNKAAKSRNVGYDKVYYHIVDTYYKSGQADWTEEDQLQKIINNSEKMKGSFIGETATKFEFKTLSDNVLNFDYLKSDYTILFFTDLSSETAVRFEKQLAEVKNKLPENTNILRVILGNSPSDILIYADQISATGTNVVPNNNGSLIMKYYNLNTIPMLYILDKNHKIIMKHINFSQVQEYLENLN